jgi:hypothetical protein
MEEERIRLIGLDNREEVNESEGNSVMMNEMDCV